MSARVLVTGGAGFIGSHSVDALLARGVPVTVLDDFSSGRHENLPEDPKLRVVTGDIADPDAVEDALDGVERVLHLAAQVSVRRSLEAPALSARTNLLGFAVLVDACRRRGVARLVYASSAAVYGIPASLPLDETSPAAPLSPYGFEKLSNDGFASLASQLYGLRCLGLRYFNVYGPRQDSASSYSGVIARFAAALREERPLRIFGDGLQTRDFIYVGDVARVNLRALDSSALGVANVGTGRSVTLMRLISALATAAGKPAELLHEPPVAGDIRHSATRINRLRSWFPGFFPLPLEDGLRLLYEAEELAAQSG